MKRNLNEPRRRQTDFEQKTKLVARKKQIDRHYAQRPDRMNELREELERTTKGKSKANNSFCKQTKIGSRKKTPSDRSTLTDRRTKSQSKYFNLQIGGTQGFIHAVHARYQKQCKIVTRIIHAHADTNGHSHTQTHTHKHAHEQSHALQIREHARTNACTLAHKQPRTHTHSLKCCT